MRGQINPENDSEEQADKFAVALLLPFHHVQTILRVGGTHKEICTWFKSSQESTRRRIEFVKEKMHEYRF